MVERALDAGCVPTLALVDAASAARRDRTAGRADHRVRRRRPDARRRSPTGHALQRRRAVPSDRLGPRSPSCVRRQRGSILAEAVDNPVNIGSIVRNALALGWHGLVIDATSVDPLARRAMRVSMGHALHLPHARTLDMLATIRELDRRRLAGVRAHPRRRRACRSTTCRRHDKVALLVGSERAGPHRRGDGGRHASGEHPDAVRRRLAERRQRHRGRLLAAPRPLTLRTSASRRRR